MNERDMLQFSWILLKYKVDPPPLQVQGIGVCLYLVMSYDMTHALMEAKMCHISIFTWLYMKDLRVILDSVIPKQQIFREDSLFFSKSRKNKKIFSGNKALQNGVYKREKVPHHILKYQSIPVIL